MPPLPPRRPRDLHRHQLAAGLLSAACGKHDGRDPGKLPSKLPRAMRRMRQEWDFLRIHCDQFGPTVGPKKENPPFVPFLTLYDSKAPAAFGMYETTHLHKERLPFSLADLKGAAFPGNKEKNSLSKRTRLEFHMQGLPMPLAKQKSNNSIIYE